MFFADLAFFWNAARALALGQDPYAVEGFYYPLPTLFVFMPFVFLPLPVAIAPWVSISLIIVVLVLKRRALLWAFFVPTIMALGTAQFTPLLFGFLPLLVKPQRMGLLLGLGLLKPHIIAGALPFLWVSRAITKRDLFIAAGIYAALGVPAFLFMPDWPLRWIIHAIYAHQTGLSPTLWGFWTFLPVPWWLLASIASTLLAWFFAWRKQVNVGFAFVLSLLVNPLIIPYDLVLLTPFISRIWQIVILIVASYVIWWPSMVNQNAVPFVGLTLLALVIMRLPFTPPIPTSQTARSKIIAAGTIDTPPRG